LARSFYTPFAPLIKIKFLLTSYSFNIYTLRMKHGSGKRRESKLLSVWVPKSFLPLLDEGVRKEDSDRSKFIRNAIREKLARDGSKEGKDGSRSR
jgi:hypothetical protein